MMEMEISQRKAEGDREGFEEGSKYCQKFNVWKLEKEKEVMTKHEDRFNPTAADKTNNTHEGREQEGQKIKQMRKETKAVTKKAKEM